MRKTSQIHEDGPKQPQRERGRARVAALLDAAAAVFVDKGYEAATMTEIAARAESSIGSLYQFFRTKELVADALMGRYAEVLLARLAEFEAQAEGWSVEELGTRLSGAFIEFRAEHPAFAALAEAQGAPTPRILEFRAQLRRQIAAILRRKAPSLAAADLEVTASVTLQMMKATVSMNAEPGLPRKRAVLDELKGLLQRYLRERLGSG
jgi:AcrR family transcriptional regulator